MVATAAALNRRLAELNRQTRVLFQRVEARETEPAPPVRRSALELAAELGIALDPWQRDVVMTEAHDVLVCVSRQGGKGTAATVLALDTLINDPGSTVVIISKTERQARRLFRRIRRAYRRLTDTPSPLVDTTTELELRNGSQAIALPGHEEGVRGVDACDLLIVDEAAVVPDELYLAVLPFLATTDGRQALFSSARERSGFFWRRYDALGPWAPGAVEADGWHRATIPAEAIPRIKPGFLDRQRRLMGERIYRREYGCEFLAEAEGALWTLASVDRHRLLAVPDGVDLARVVVGVDPPASREGAECGIVVVGRGSDKRGYVLADRSRRGTPNEWATAVVAAFDAFDADAVVIEVNQGGEMATNTLRTVRPTLSIVAVHASRGKATRAEPIAALYGQGHVSHVGAFPVLEDQMTTWVPGGLSPDRMDALVWAATEALAPLLQRPLPASPPRAVPQQSAWRRDRYFQRGG